MLGACSRLLLASMEPSVPGGVESSIPTSLCTLT
ncbi:MAG: hypothetical protein QOI68_5757 [Pseudonocardiales bacterium]|jgi:hypothetical protein|nr:hypothetical protein [Pseudonocardiales bacterium]